MLVMLILTAVWCVFWLLCVNWNKLWTVLSQGAWTGVVLLGLISALVWTKLDDRSCDCLGFMILPSFWWQLGTVATVIALALFCGWLQGVIRYAPVEVSVEMPTGHDGHGHGHDHGHAHDHGHDHQAQVHHDHGHAHH